jgi:spore germination protein YaaH
VAPYDWVERVLAYATSVIPTEKVLLGVAFYGYDWNATTPSARALGYAQAVETLARFAGVPVEDEVARSATFRYEVPYGEELPPTRMALPRHEVAVRRPPPCDVVPPAATPAPVPSGPRPGPDDVQQHEVWFEEGSGVAARLALAARYGAGGVAAWRLGQEDPEVWPAVAAWRRDGPDQ